MDTFYDWGIYLVEGIPFLLTQPFFYFMFFVLLLMCQRHMDRERKVFGTRVSSSYSVITRSLLTGIVAGLLLSALLIVAGVVLSLTAYLWLWILAAFLSLFRLRFLTMIYPGVLLTFLVLLFRIDALSISQPDVQYWMQQISLIHVPSLWAFIACLLFMEAVLIFFVGHRRAYPVYEKGKRGKLVGGYRLEHIWPVPVFVLFMSQDATGIQLTLYDGWPIFYAESMWPLVLLLLPVVLQYHDRVQTMLPRRKTIRIAPLFALNSLLLFGASLVANYWVDWLIWITASLAIPGYEGLRWLSRRAESRKAARFVHDKQGIGILDIVHGSPAHQMGLQAGEIITSVNGQSVTSSQSLYDGLAMNKAHCKMGVLNTDGHIKFVQRSMYEGEPHQLGVILAPDQEMNMFVNPKEQGVIELLFFGPLKEKIRQRKEYENV